jgi:putative oxidoreductase
MSVIFILAGFQKLQDPGGTAQYFAHVHIPIPDVAVWVAIVIELLGGLLLLIGFKARWVALILAIFCLVTGFGVHLPVGDQANMINFLKNLAMAGGFLYVFAFGAGVLSIDGPGK